MGIINDQGVFIGPPTIITSFREDDDFDVELLLWFGLWCRYFASFGLGDFYGNSFPELGKFFSQSSCHTGTWINVSARNRINLLIVYFYLFLKFYQKTG